MPRLDRPDGESLEKNQSPELSEDDLRRFARNVLDAPIELFLNGNRLLVNHGDRLQALNDKKRLGALAEQSEIDESTLLVSTLLAHYLLCRQIDDFLTQEPSARHPDGAHASMFFPDPKVWKTAMSEVSPVDPSAREMVNKIVAHMTFSNPQFMTSHVDFTADYTLFILRGLETFLRAVEGGPIDEAMRRVRLRDVSAHRREFELIVAKENQAAASRRAAGPR